MSNLFIKSENIERYLFFDEARRTANFDRILCNDWDQGFFPEIHIFQCLNDHRKNISVVFKNRGVNQIHHNLNMRCWHFENVIAKLESIYSLCKISSKILLDRVKSQDKVFLMLGMTSCFSITDKNAMS